MFCDYIPESKLCFCVNLSRPPCPWWIRPMQKLLNCQTRTHRAVGATPSTPIGEQLKIALWLWVREITWYLYTRGERGRMKANTADLKLLDTVSWMVSSFSASCSWRPLDWRIRHSHLASTLFHSLENSAMGTWPIYKNSIIPNWLKNGVI